MQTDRYKPADAAKWTAAPAFDDLYAQYKSAVFSFACYLTKNRGEAEDLFQEAWLRIVKHLPEKVNQESLKSWIFTIVANLHRDHLRKQRIRRLFKQSQAPSQPPEMMAAQVSADTTQLDLGKDIAQAIAKLPERQRRVFVLKEVAGFQQAEIGDMLGMPLGTVKSLMYRAVQRLQQELSAYNPKKERIKCDVKILSV